LYLINLKVIN